MAPDIAPAEVRAYLLGALDEASAAALESRYVGDPALIEAIRDEEDALVADYLDDRLTAVDRARFNRHYLASPVHRERVALARALVERAAATAPRAATAPSFYGWLAMAAAVVLMSLWLVGRPGPAPREAHGPIPAPSPAPLPSPAPPPAVPSPGPAAPSTTRAAMAIALSAVSVRGAPAAPAHELPAEPVDLLLRLEGTPDLADRAFDVEVQRVDGTVVWRGRVRTASRGSGLLATAAIPAGTLSPDDYVVVASTGGAERGRYSLRLRAPRR